MFTALVIMLSVVLLAILGWTIFNRYLRPLDEIKATLARLLSGDYAARVPHIDSHHLDFLGENINKLAARFESTYKDLSSDRSRLSRILGNMVEAVIAVDNQSRVLALNPAFSTLFGVDVQNAAGRPFTEIVRHTAINQLIHKVLSNGRSATEEITTWTPDERVFEAQAVALLQNGLNEGALLVLHDITPVRKLEQVRKDFVANVSHELRTPLASIKGFAETLREGALDDKENRLSFVKSIENQADRMTELVDDLLDLTAIESGKRPTLKEPFSFYDTANDLISSMQQLATRNKVTLLAEGLERLPEINCDRHQIRQVLTNLLQNAIKFNKEGGSVTISGEANEDWLILYIKDSGIGIPSLELPRVFERFYRVDKARSREMGGTGLGLAIVKHIIEAHSGQVSVESVLGQGSTFRFSLPRNS